MALLEFRGDSGTSSERWHTGGPGLPSDWLTTGNTWKRAEKAALAEIRRLRRKGTPFRGIAAALNQGAYQTRRGTPWRLESVARILKPEQNG